MAEYLIFIAFKIKIKVLRNLFIVKTTTSTSVVNYSSLKF